MKATDLKAGEAYALVKGFGSRQRGVFIRMETEEEAREKHYYGRPAREAVFRVRDRTKDGGVEEIRIGMRDVICLWSTHEVEHHEAEVARAQTEAVRLDSAFEASRAIYRALDRNDSRLADLYLALDPIRRSYGEKVVDGELLDEAFKFAGLDLKMVLKRVKS